jgi:hypothetical protein
LWRGGNHLHKDCAEIESLSSTPTCCNCHLAERDNTFLLLSGLQACKRRDVKEEVPENTQDYDWKDVLFKLHDSQLRPSQRSFEATQSKRSDHIYARIQ